MVHSQIDVERQVRGPAWLLVLSSGHVDALGGEAALAGVPGTVEPLSGGRFLLTVTPDAADVDTGRLAAARAFLAPVLPVGFRPLEAYPGPVPYRL